MISKKIVIYRFLCIWWVLITMAPRNRTMPSTEPCGIAPHRTAAATTREAHARVSLRAYLLGPSRARIPCGIAPHRIAAAMTRGTRRATPPRGSIVPFARGKHPRRRPKGTHVNTRPFGRGAWINKEPRQAITLRQKAATKGDYPTSRYPRPAWKERGCNVSAARSTSSWKRVRKAVQSARKVE